MISKFADIFVDKEKIYILSKKKKKNTEKFK